MALALRPRSVAVLNNLGNALSEQGKLDEAIACYRRAIELDPKFALAHNNLGVALQDQGKLDEAIACYRKAIELDPKCAPAHSNLGDALEATGKTGRGHRRATARPSNSTRNTPWPTTTSASLLKDQGKLDEAIAGTAQAIELDPKCAAPTTTSASP